MWLPEALHTAARRSKEIIFFCPYGHPQHFPQGENEATILRRERDLARQQIAEREDKIKMLDRLLHQERGDAMALRKAATKAKKRTAAGTCPCCHRTFRQMALHMANKHPEFEAEAVA
jgi:hypothetical protein